MSMLIRTGTLVRKHSRKASVRRTKSAGSTASGGHFRPPDEDDNVVSSVPASPVAKFHNMYTEHNNSLNSSPGKASVATTNSTIVSFDENQLTYKTSLDRTCSGDHASFTATQDTVLQIEEANKEADNICDFLCTASRIVCSSTFMTSAVGLSMVIPIVMISLGVKYLDDCPLQPRIPIFHMVGGCFGVLKIALTLWRSVQRRHQGSIDNLFDGGERGITSRTYRSMDVLLSLFLLAWHVLGTVWVLSIWKPRFKPLLHRPNQWCERSLYFFSVAIIIGVYTVLALILVGMGCLACAYRTNNSQRGHR